MRTRLVPLFLVLVEALPAGGAVSCGSPGESHPPAERDARRVQVQRLAPVRERTRIELSGELVAHDRIEVATKVAGRVLEISVTEGTSVRRGQVLARLDSPELRFSVAQSEAAEAAARVNAQTSARQVERYRRLATGQVVTPRDLETTEVAAAAAEAAYSQAKSMAEMSRQNLEYAVLRAPLDGVVVRRMTNLGDLVLPGMPVVIMEDESRLEVKTTLPVETPWTISSGDSALVEVTLGDPDQVPARVDRVSPSADGHAILAYVAAPGVHAPTGSFVRVTLFGPQSQDVLRVPEKAVFLRGPLTGVFVVEEGRAVLRWLRLTNDGRVAAGLAAGDSVVVTPPADLADGDRVEAGR